LSDSANLPLDFLTILTSGPRYVKNFHFAAIRFGMMVVLLAGGSQFSPLHAQADSVAKKPTAVPIQTASASPQAAAPKVDWNLPAENHPWARFPIGAWREIEITTETFDESGKLFGRSVTTQKEILKAVTEDNYVIDVQATVDVSGKRIEGPWNTRVLRLSTDRAGAIFSTTRQADHSMALSIGTVSCQVWEVEYNDENRTLVDRIYYSSEIFPHVLARNVIEQSEASPVEAAPLDSITTVARSVPYSLEGKILDCVSQQTVKRREKGNSQTMVLLSSEVPGAEIEAQSTDFDSSGRRIRWSVQKLLNHGQSSDTPTVATTQEASQTSTPNVSQ
jgi:hypothetical protein